VGKRNKPTPEGHAFVSSRGYRVVKLNGRWHYEHRLKMQVHLGRRLGPDDIVHHKDGNPLNNDLDNLEVLSPGAHSRHHNLKHPLVLVCENCGIEFTPHPSNRGRQRFCSHACKRVGKLPGGANFTMNEAREIRARYAAGERQVDLAARYGVGASVISRIVNGKAYREP
jgi:HNH endonuclease